MPWQRGAFGEPGPDAANWCCRIRTCWPDRGQQVRYINEQVRKALSAGQPVISVDTKKKELIGNFQNQGRQWRKMKSPIAVNGHDFADATGLSILVCQFPPDTSKWNKVVHRLFSFISSNWRAEPLRDYETVGHPGIQVQTTLPILIFSFGAPSWYFDMPGS